MSPTAAALWIVTGMAVFGFSDNLVPLLADDMSVWQVMALRSVLALPVAAAALLFVGGGRAQLVGRRPGRVAVRSLFGAAALFVYFGTMPAVGLGLAAAGMFTSPIWILLISALLFGERIGPLRIFAVILGSAGMALVLGIGAVPMTPMTVVPVTAGLFYAWMVIWTRRHCADESSLALATGLTAAFLVLGALGVVLTPLIGGMLDGVGEAAFLYHPWAEVTVWQWLILAAIGVSALLGSALVATGYRSGPSSVVGLFDYSFLVWGPFFAWLLRDEAVSPRVAAGMALIGAAGILAARAGQRRSAADSDAASEAGTGG